MNFRRKVCISAVGVIVISIVWIFRPYQSYETSKLISEISTLQTPLESVATSYWMDGGSVGIYITDGTGKEFRALFPQADNKRLLIGSDQLTMLLCTRRLKEAVGLRGKLLWE